MSKRSPLIIKGADKSITIAPGDWYQNPKAHPKRLMLDSLSSKARQVYACIEHAAMSYQQELAVVTLKGGKTRPMTPADIADQTDLDPSDVAHGFEELEAAALAGRRDDDGKGLRRGHVRLYCFAIPPHGEDARFPGARARKGSPDFRPPWVDSRPEDDPLRLYINRCKISFSPDFVVARDNIEAAEVAARAMQEAEKVVRAALESCGAQFPLIRKKQLETTGETTGQVPAVSVVSKKAGSSSSSSVLPTTTTIGDEPTKPTPPPPMPEAIWEEARRLTQSRSFPKAAVEDYWQLCQKLAGDRGPLDAEAVTRIMQRTAAAGGSVKTFGYFAKAAADQVQAYLDHGAEEPAMAAAAGASEWDRIWAEVEAEES